MESAILMGIGNEMDGDDAAGPYAARYAESIEHEGWDIINAGNVPENYTAIIRRKNPEFLVIIDAADMGLQPGDIRRIPPRKTGTLAISTHSIPLSVLVGFLEESVEELYLIGIQVNPKNLSIGAEMGEYMRTGAEKAVSEVFNGRWMEIESV